MQQRTRRSFLEDVGVSFLGLPLYSSLSLASSNGNDLPGSRPLKDRVGVTHVGGNYHLTGEDFLNEGAKQIRGLGSRVIKLWFHHVSGDDQYNKYPYNSDWSNFDSMVEIAESNYFRELFDRDFRTYVLVAYAHVDDGYGDGYKHYFIHDISDDQLRQEEQCFYEFTKHLLDTYRGTGKEFILQHWQGDWAILPYEDREEITSGEIRADDPEPTQGAINGMIRWLNARQRGVERARSEVESDVTVLHAAEINTAIRAMKGQSRVINAVIPETDVDLVSHNSYREMWRALRRWNPNEAPAKFREILDYVNDHAPEPSAYVQSSLPVPDKNVFVGEYGLPVNIAGEAKTAQITALTTRASLEWGTPYTLYWQIYGNENGKGFWLIGPDGSKTQTWEYFKSVLSENSLGEPITYAQLVFDFNESVEEYEVNPDTPKDESRALTFRCSELDLVDSYGESLRRYDIGRPPAEPILTDGVSHKSSNDERSWRWFVAEDGTLRTVAYVERSLFEAAHAVRIRGYPVRDSIEADVVVDGETVDHIDFETGPGWANYSTEITVPTTSKQTTTSTTSDISASMTTETTATVQRTPSQTTTDSATTVPGFGIPATSTGLAAALAGYWHKKYE